MKRFNLNIILIIFALLLPFYTLQAKSDKEIKLKIIQQSINSYPRNCPCPYNRARDGSRCGKRSAYSRSGGYTPICYESDITTEMLRRYK